MNRTCHDSLVRGIFLLAAKANLSRIPQVLPKDRLWRQILEFRRPALEGSG